MTNVPPPPPAAATKDSRSTLYLIIGMLVAVVVGLGVYVAMSGGDDDKSTSSGSGSTATTEAAGGAGSGRCEVASGDNWSLDAGSNWSEMEPGITEKMWSLAGGIGTVNVLTEYFPAGETYSLGEYVDAATPQLADAIENAMVEDTSPYNGDCVEMTLIDYTGTPGGTMVYFRAAVAVNEAQTKAVIVTYASGNRDAYEENLDEVMAAVDTLALD